MFKIKLISFFIGISFVALAQEEVEWASELRAFSTQRAAKQNSAKQVIGRPNAVLGHSESKCEWQPEKENAGKEEFVHVRFKRPNFAHQVVICQGQNPGAIVKVIAINTSGGQKTIYENENPSAVSDKDKVLNIIFEKPSKTKIRDIRVVIDSRSVKGWNGIDAIGITTSKEKFVPKVHTADNAKYGNRENLGHAVNSAFIEYLPQISPDGKMLYFARRNHPDNTGSSGADDIWYSKLKGKTWSNAVKADKTLNNKNPNFVYTITPDGNTLLLGNTYTSGDVATEGVASSFKSGNGWSQPAALQIKSYKNISPHNEFCMGANKKAMVMSINDGNSLGDNDLYVSFIQKDRTWSKPLNLGEMINTAGAEASPFLSADAKTLYFSSDGYLSFGKSDIYVSKRLDDSWTNWSEPVNMGSVINTPENELYYSIPASGSYAYFVSRNQTLGESDIFRVKLPEAVKPYPVTLVTGKVINKLTGKPVQALVNYDQLPEGIEVGEASTDPETEEYKIVIPQDHMYSLHATLEGYYPIAVRIDEENVSDHHYHQIKKDLYVVPLVEGEVVLMNNIRFERSKAEFLEYSTPELERLAQFMKAKPNSIIKLIGHTDNQGAKDWNHKLSVERVKKVKAFLVEQGIESKRIKMEGRGGTEPVSENDKEENRALNRRVEVQFIKIN